MCNFSVSFVHVYCVYLPIMIYWIIIQYVYNNCALVLILLKVIYKSVVNSNCIQWYNSFSKYFMFSDMSGEPLQCTFYRIHAMQNCKWPFEHGDFTNSLITVWRVNFFRIACVILSKVRVGEQSHSTFALFYMFYKNVWMSTRCGHLWLLLIKHQQLYSLFDR